jgi:hypothetical protein
VENSINYQENFSDNFLIGFLYCVVEVEFFVNVPGASILLVLYLEIGNRKTFDP